jgi:hypothetical protein
MNDQRYYFEVGSAKDVNELIEWWNAILFKYGRVSVFDFKHFCGIKPYYRDLAFDWSFTLTTENFETYDHFVDNRLKTDWCVSLPEPTSILYRSYDD